MGALGVNYMQYQAAQAMRDAAQNTGGGAVGAGLGLGAGVGLGQILGQSMGAGLGQPQQPAPVQPQQPPPAAATPSHAAGATGGAQTKAQVQQALSNLDIRLANGEISEGLYNKLQANLSKLLETAPE